MLSWAALISGFLRLLNIVGEYLNNKQLMDAGRSAQRAETAEKANEAIVDKRKTESDVAGLTDEQLDDELREWTEKKPTSSS